MVNVKDVKQRLEEVKKSWMRRQKKLIQLILMLIGIDVCFMPLEHHSYFIMFYRMLIGIY